MKKKLLFLMLLALAVVIAAPGISLAEPDICINGSFEDVDTSGIPEGWSHWSSGTTDTGDLQGQWITDPGNAYEGGDVYLEMISDNGSQSTFRSAWDIDISAYPPGSSYTISVMVRKKAGEANGQCWLGFEFYEGVNRVGAGKNEYGLAQDVTSENWTEFTHTATAPIAGDAGERTNGSTGASTFAIDAIWATPMIGIEGGSSILQYDDCRMGKDYSRMAKATIPVPDTGAQSQDPLAISSLSWTNATLAEAQKTHPTATAVMVDAYFDTNQALVAEKNSGCAAIELNAGSSTPVTITGGNTYYWMVQTKANTTAGWEDLGADVWSFDTINRAPTVDAGLGGTLWVDAGNSPASRTISLSGTVSDDPLPVGGTLRTSWTSSPAGGVSFGDYLSEDTTVTFTNADTYTLTLTANDNNFSGLVTTDTTTVTVVASGDTRLVAHWTLDDATGTDQVGNAHPGTVVGAVAVAGQIDGALSFDAANGDHVEIEGTGYMSDPNDFPAWADTLVDGLTVSCWMKSDTDGTSDGWAGLVSRDNTAWELVKNNDDHVKFALQSGVADEAVTNAGLVDTVAFDSQWHHIVGTFDGAYARIYIDGMLADEVASNESKIATGMANIMIGQTVNPSDDNQPVPQTPALWSPSNFSGLIDDVRIYDVAIPLVSVNGSPGIRQMYVDGGGRTNCGGQYAATDVNGDCYSSLGDFAVIFGDWLTCQDIANPACD